MDIATGLGLAAGAVVIVSLIMMGGDLRMFMDLHAFIVQRRQDFETTVDLGRNPGPRSVLRYWLGRGANRNIRSLLSSTRFISPWLYFRYWRYKSRSQYR